MSHKSFEEFYPYYLSQHQNLMGNRLHFAGCALAVLCLLGFIFTLKFHFILLGIILFYGCSLIGDYVFEKKKPTTFESPHYSFMAEWVMYKDIITGKVKIW